MKKVLSIVIVIALLATQFVLPTFAADSEATVENVTVTATRDLIDRYDGNWDVEYDEEENEIVLSAPFECNSEIQKYLEENGFEIKSSEFVRIPNDLKEVNEEQRTQIEKLLEKFEDDDDVQNVFHNMKEEDEE